DAGIGAEGAHRLCGVVGACRGSRCRPSVRIDAIAEAANHSKDFKMRIACRFRRSLKDQVRHWVEGVIRGRVIEATAVPGGSDEQVGRQVVAADRVYLRILDRHTDPELVIEVLGNAEAELARPSEADDVVRVYHEWQRFSTIVEPLPRLGEQAPLLAAGNGPAVVEGHLPEQLAHAVGVAVALVAVGSDAGREPIHFIVAGQFHAGGFPLDEEAEARLATRSVKFWRVAGSAGGERDRVERRINVTGQSALAG